MATEKDVPAAICEVMIDPAEIPPNAIFILTSERRYTEQQHKDLQAWWAQGPLKQFEVLLLDGGMQVRIVVPVDE